MEDDEVDLSERAVCTSCVGNPYLKEQMPWLGAEHRCHYCGKEGVCIDLESLAGMVEVAFEDHFVLTARDPDGFEHAMLKDPEGTFRWERAGDPVAEVIAANAGVSDALAADIREWLYELNDDWDASLAGWENPFDAEACYSQMPPDDEDLHRDWIAFEQSLKAESRFFNKRAMQLLQGVFGSAVEAETRSGDRWSVRSAPAKT